MLENEKKSKPDHQRDQIDRRPARQGNRRDDDRRKRQNDEWILDAARQIEERGELQQIERQKSGRWPVFQTIVTRDT